MQILKNIIKEIVADFMKGFNMPKFLGFLINNQEPVGLKALNLEHCTKPKKTLQNEDSISPTIETKKTQKKQYKPQQSWTLPSNVQRSAFYQSLKDIENKN